jgi:drug/metabolite transporter (DMT)-like permease
MGDTSFYAALKRLGPRRTGILFTTNAPMAAIMGYFVLGESLPFHMTLGCILIMVGVLLAVFFGASARQKHAFEKIQLTFRSSFIVNWGNYSQSTGRRS